MASITGIELGTDSCVLVRARQVREATEVSSVRVVFPAEWPPRDNAQADLLRRIRREEGLSRRARVVAWRLPEAASVSDPATQGFLRPLKAAGFRVDAVMSPAQALARLAAARPRPGDAAAAWLALNRRGVAIAIVRGSQLLFSREFDWSYKGTAGSPNAQLLERYSLVAHLAPELRRGIDMVRASSGVQVDSAITCGDLPDLRSLTMPLIEELDLEVETLDSTDGFILTSKARTQRAAELAPALRLASAATSAAATGHRAFPAWMKVGAAALVILAGGALAYSRWPTRPVPARHVAASSVQPRSPRPQTPVRPAPSKPAPVAVEPAKAEPKAADLTTRALPKVRRPAEQAPAPPPRPSATNGTERATKLFTPKPNGSAADISPAPAPSAPARPRPLNAPVPSVSSILISSDRRLAVINGKITAIGDPVGPRVLTRIEPSYVVFREPSGLELKVALR